MNNLINEQFSETVFSRIFQWYNEPSNWSINNETNRLVIYTDSKTDYWQKTGYGFEADNGHFLYAEVSGDFTIATKVNFYPKNQYDQAGLMIRCSKHCWIKTSVEYEIDEPSRLGVVVTNNGYSDWSVQDFPKDLNSVTLRIKREGSDYTVEYFDSYNWKLLRLTHLTEGENETIKAGIYACSPKGKGYKTEFEYITIEHLK